MKRLHILKTSLLGILSFFLTDVASAQCAKFADSPQGGDAETAHVLYRQDYKLKNYDTAYPNWKKAYEIAPAADGQRASHYSDGRNILKHLLKNEADEAKKAEYIATILRLYDEQITCYENEAYLLGRKAFDMFYEFRTPYLDVLEVLKKSVKKGGNETEYIVLDPFAHVVVNLFSNEKISKEEARKVYTKLNEIADHNIANNEKFGEQFKASKASMNTAFATIENYIFDCEYFVAKLRPDYEADPDNPEVLEQLIVTLKTQGCTAEEPFLAELEGKWAKYADAINAQRQAEFEKNNPNVMAKKMYDAGDYAGALAKYEEAVASAEDNDKKADYYFAMASICFRKLTQYSKAREYARKAGSNRSGWGQPYLLIGDMYGKSSRTCGEDAYTRGLAVLAAIEKYQYAKSIDPKAASDANKRIANYQGSIPPKEEVFMRGKNGATVKVPCWIGETVKVRYK